MEEGLVLLGEPALPDTCHLVAQKTVNHLLGRKGGEGRGGRGGRGKRVEREEGRGGRGGRGKRVEREEGRGGRGEEEVGEKEKRREKWGEVGERGRAREHHKCLAVLLKKKHCPP